MIDRDRDRVVLRAGAALTLALALALLCLQGCGASSPSTRSSRGLAGWYYSLTLDRGLSSMHATVCFDGPAPDALIALSPSAPRYLRGASTRGRPLAIDRARGQIVLTDVPPRSCVSYDVALDDATADVELARRSGRDLVTTTSLWLYAPSGDFEWAGPRAPRVSARFELPDGMHASTPWPVRAGSPGEHVLDEHAFAHIAYVAFGRFEPRAFDAPGGVAVDLAVLDGPIRLDGAAIERWIGSATSAVSTLSGRFPVERAQVLVMPVAARASPVPFGIVTRGGGASVLLLLASDAEEPAVIRDWTAVHELTHLFLPYVAREDCWLSEGLATYYQEVLRARARIVTPEQAWLALDDGFRRGRASGTGARLFEESARVQTTHAYERVYWAGAAMMLLADVALRSQTDNALSLDTSVAAVGRCCAGRAGRWTANDVIARIDGAGHGATLAAIARTHLTSADFPDVTETFARLGVRIDHGRVRFDDAAPDATVRRAIMREGQAP